jgi:hypothetical protein
MLRDHYEDTFLTTTESLGKAFTMHLRIYQDKSARSQGKRIVGMGPTKSWTIIGAGS